MIGNFIGGAIGEPFGAAQEAAAAPVWFENNSNLMLVPARMSTPPQAVMFKGDDGNYRRPEVFRDYGFHVQPWQPPQRGIKRHAAAILEGDDGTQGRLPARFVDYGFHVQPWQPPTPTSRWEKFAATVGGHSGTDDILRQPLQTASFRWFETNYVFPRKNFARAGAILEGDDGTQGPFRRFFNYGFHIQPWQPPTPTARWEKQAATVGGDPGTQARFQVFRNYGFHVQPWQPPNYRQRFDASAIFTGDQGHYAPKPWVNQGWQVQYVDVKKPRPERSGILQSSFAPEPRGALLTSEYAWGYTQGAIDYCRPKHYRGAALFRGHDGIDNIFTFLHIDPSDLRVVFVDVAGREVQVSIGGRIVYVDVSERVVLADASNREIEQ